MTALDPDALAAITARAEAADSGPWTAIGSDPYDVVIDTGGASLGVCPDCGVRASFDRTDAEFIAHARTDVKVLVAEVRRLTEEVMAHQVSEGYDKGYEHGTLTAGQYKQQADRWKAKAKNAEITSGEQFARAEAAEAKVAEQAAEIERLRGDLGFMKEPGHERLYVRYRQQRDEARAALAAVRALADGVEADARENGHLARLSVRELRTALSAFGVGGAASAVGEHLTLTDAEHRNLRAAHERDGWANEWNSLPTAVERIKAAAYAAGRAAESQAHADLRERVRALADEWGRHRNFLRRRSPGTTHPESMDRREASTWDVASGLLRALLDADTTPKQAEPAHHWSCVFPCECDRPCCAPTHDTPEEA